MSGMELEEIIKHGKMVVQTKQDLFLKVAALNYLNALVKKPEYKKTLGYGLIKPAVMHLTMELAKNNQTGICEDICYHPNEDSLYLRCYGIQFCFHCVGVSILEEECPQLSNKDVKWDGVKLQPIAEPLYELAKEAVVRNLDENTVRERIQIMIK